MGHCLVAAMAIGGLAACAPPAAQSPPLADSSFVVPPLGSGLADAGPAPLTPGDGVRFGHPAARVGDRWSVSVFAESLVSDPQGGEQVSTYRSEYAVEVLAIDGPAPSRVRLELTRNVNAYQYAEKPSIIHGKVYVVDARAPHVRDASSMNEPPEAEIQRVLDVFPDLGARARIDQVLPEEVMRVGERKDELAAAILRVIHPRAWTLTSGSAVLARRADDHAAFEVAIDATSASGLQMSIRGEARVRLRDARLMSLDLRGSYVTVAAPEPGTFRLRLTVQAE